MPPPYQRQAYYSTEETKRQEKNKERGSGMKTAEIVEFIELLRRLPEEKQRELYLMMKGASMVIEAGKIA